MDRFRLWAIGKNIFSKKIGNIYSILVIETGIADIGG